MAEDKSTPKGANKYSVYAQRDVESTQVNYADAAATLTESFTDVRDDRKKRKEDLEDSFDKTMSVLDQVEDMQTQTAGEKITQASQMSVDSLVKQNQMMKNGEITVRDYQRFEGRLKSGYANVNKVVKNWDKWQGETNTRMTEGKSGYPSRLHGRLVLDLSQLVWLATRETTSGGEFGWGGTSVKR